MHLPTSSHGLSRELRVTQARPTPLFFTAWYRFFRVYLIYSSYFKIYFCSCSKELSRFDYLSFLAPESHFRVSRSLCTFSSLVVQFSRTIACLPLALCDLFIISHFLAFVKGFCKSFLSFFLKLFRLAVLGFARLRPLYYITFSSVCQEVFQKFFRKFLRVIRKPFEKLSRWQLIYYSTFFSLCQAFF